MNFLDACIFSFFQQLYGHSTLFDGFMSLLTRNNLLKNGFLVCLLWWFWFQTGERREIRRKQLIASVCGGIIAVGAARYLALVLPFRVRPVLEPTLQSLFPIHLSPGYFDGMSSFPSDHAVLFFAIAGGGIFVSRMAGILGCCWVLLVICLPRVYVGFHYATDILAGAAIGIAIAWIANTPVVRDRVSRWPMEWLRRHCASFYVVAFLLSWQIATLFDDIRDLGKCLFLALSTY